MPGKNREGVERAGQAWGLQDIAKLIDLLIEREISEFEMEKDGLRVRIRRGEAHPSAAAPAVGLAPPAPALGAPPASVTPATSVAPAEATSPESTEGLYIIKSPMVGTFYRNPSPNAEPFVHPGDVVNLGQVLCIIEAMKLMNEIASEVNGEVVRIYVENGQPVEYGQSLFALKPSHKK